MLLSKHEMFGESSLTEHSKRSGTVTALSETICSAIGRKDIERSLGTGIHNLIFYNIKKWALLRSNDFKEFDHANLNAIIMAFQTVIASAGE
jgi:hypothetical protein